MPRATVVTLPTYMTPRFPEKCVVCHEKPDSTIKIVQKATNAYLAFFAPLLAMFGWSRVTIPICQKCKPRFRWQRWVRNGLCWAIILVAILIGRSYFKEWSTNSQKAAVLGLAIVALLPYELIEYLWPRFFNTHVKDHAVKYNFASKEYAQEFAVLNHQSRE